MSIIRVRRTGNFTVIPNEVINDQELSGSELGLLVYLLSKPEDWRISVAGLAGAKRFGALEKVSGDLKKLREKGYALLQRHGDGSVTWTITDNKHEFGLDSEKPNQAKPHPGNPNEAPRSENPNSGFPNMGNPRSENPNSENPNSGFPNHTKERDIQNTEEREEFFNARALAREEFNPGDEKRLSDRRAHVAIMLRNLGVKITSINPDLCTWVNSGITDEEVRETVERARLCKPEPEEIAASYLSKIVPKVLGEREMRKEKAPVATNQKPGLSKTQRGDYAKSGGVIQPTTAAERRAAIAAVWQDGAFDMDQEGVLDA